MASQALKKYQQIERDRRLSVMPGKDPDRPKYVKEDDHYSLKASIDKDILYLQGELEKLRNLTKNIQIQNALGIQALGNLQTSSSSSGTVTVALTGTLYFGDSTTDGSWRIYVSGTDLVIERRESGVWVEKGAYQP